MKKTLLTFFALAIAACAHAQFTPNNLVVTKVTPNSTYNRAATVSLEEYAPIGGAAVSSTNLSIGDDFYLPYGSASNQFTGYLNLSTDQQLLTLYGYNQLPPSAGNTELFSINAPSRTFVAVNANQTVTKIVTNAHTNANVNRGAVAYPLGDGTYGTYLFGHGAGTRYSVYDPTSATLSTSVSVNSLNTISAKIYHGKLYASSQVGNIGVNAFDANLPTAASSVTSPAPLLALTNAHDFVLFKIGANQVMYVGTAANAATAADGLFKYYSTDHGATWTAAGKIDGNISTVADNGFRFLTGRIENDKITIYAVTSNNTTNSIKKITDETAYNTTIGNATVGITISNVATAPTGSGFRGLAFTPGTTVTLPVTLAEKLSAKALGTHVALSWATASEQHSNRFEIWHATNGKDFSQIGQRPTNTPNGAKYSFTHNNAPKGNNYYQLQQVDQDGQRTTYGPAVAFIALSSADFTVKASRTGVSLQLNSEQALKVGSISITDITGRVVAKQQVAIAIGINQYELPLTLAKGVYVATVKGEGLQLVKKFALN